ncbi:MULTISPECIES: PBECR2 nuclease fold domain-containing protein [unclassified Pseudomonas]|uniref:PBECR2 nuclease fold domain-containing protein n=1 Tax=unclassified Pseudomonas TaxID=196821 RepID=UPI00382FB22B
MSANNPTAKVAEKRGQNTWQDEQLPDLRTHAREMRIQPIEELSAAVSHDAAMKLAAIHLGLSNAMVNSVTVATPMGVIRVQRSCIHHIVEKRQDARERYVKVALDTLTGPFEVWEVAYTNEAFRLAFIGVFETKRQMLVVVTLHNGDAVAFHAVRCKGAEQASPWETALQAILFSAEQRKGPLSPVAL